MSGIFGYSILRPGVLSAPLNKLSDWNRAYGQDDFDAMETDSFGCGCYLEHLSGKFPAAAPILRRGSMTAVIDAVLYCRSELLAELSHSDGEAISDEELLLDYIQTFGYDALARINGDFAGAVYSHETGSWTLFRDHSGIRPLYYYLDTACFVFSTDIRAILALTDIDRSINEEILYLRLMGYNELSLCETQYRHIHCIHPASWTEVSVREEAFCLDAHIYWKWCQQKIRLASDADYQQKLRELITDAVARRLDAFDGLAGCELSGGLDSSIIAILINRLGREGCYYSWSYSTDDVPLNAGRDERDIIFDICRQENIECHFARTLPGRDLDSLLAEMLPAFVNTRSIGFGSEFLRKQGARVVFTGHGGDEGVSHRANVYELWYHREYLPFFRIHYKQTAGMNLRLLRTIKNAWKSIEVGRKHAEQPFEKIFSNARRALNPSFAERMSGAVKPRPLPFSYDPHAYIMQGGHRVRMDNVAVQGAEKGVRYMLPFIDYRVLDFALSIPRHQFKNEVTNRYIYRAAFDDIIPDSLRNMRYKDMPSLQNRESAADPQEHFASVMRDISAKLDPQVWRDYLDLEYIKSAEFPQNAGPLDFSMASAMLNELSICCSVEYMLKHAPEGRKHV